MTEAERLARGIDVRCLACDGLGVGELTAPGVYVCDDCRAGDVVGLESTSRAFLNVLDSIIRLRMNEPDATRRRAWSLVILTEAAAAARAQFEQGAA
jgi:hypothetical protein